MTTPPTIVKPSTLLEDLVEQSHLSCLQLAMAVVLLAFLFLVGTAYLDGVLAKPFEPDFWRVGLIYPIVTAYCLVTVPFSKRLRDEAIGGVTLSLLLLPRKALRPDVMIMIYTPLTLTAVLVFFLNMKGIHDHMVKAKERELKLVRANLVAASRALKEQAAADPAGNVRAELDSIAAWSAHEKLIKELPEWPYTATIKRNLLLSLLLPGAVGVSREVLVALFQRLVSSP